MIKICEGDILAYDAESIVNPVNCVGVMGRGLALQFRNAYPDNFKAYAKACEHRLVQPGSMLIYETGLLTGPRYIINFPTKRHWKDSSRISDIESGLVALVAEVNNRQIHSIAIPPLGCGLGGLNWAEVRQKIIRSFEALTKVEVLLFEPQDPFRT